MARAGWCAACSFSLGLAAACVVAPVEGGELQWRRSAAAAPAPRPASGRSVVVRRDGARVAQAPGQFDPFDEELNGEDTAMPATEPAAAPAAAEPYDPFDDSALNRETASPAGVADAEPSAIESEPLVESQPTSEPGVEEAFDEPQVEEDVPSADDELERAEEAVNREIMRREVEEGAAEEMVAPEPNLLDEDAEMEDELVVPGFDEEPMEPSEDDDATMQQGLDAAEPPPLTPEQEEQRRQQIEREREMNRAACEALYDQVAADSIKNISLDIRLEGEAGEDYPFACEGRNPPFQPRTWTQVTYLWKASGLCHKPLYFEQVQLERYGHCWGPVLQPVMSGAHFFATIPILPYKMGIQTPNECVYTLGYYRPGSCAPYVIEPVPFTWRAAAFQAGAVTGAAAIIP